MKISLFARAASGKAIFLAVVMAVLAIGVAACQPGGSDIRGLKGSFDNPAFGDQFLYVSGIDGYLYALELSVPGLTPDTRSSSGILDLVWRAAVGGEPEPEPLIGGPVFVSDPDLPMVMVGSEDGNLYAFDAIEGGDPLWTFSTGGSIWSTPVVKDGIVYFGSHDEYLYALSIGEGKEKWRFKTNGTVAGRPLLFRDLVVVGSFDKKLYGIDASNGSLRWSIEGTNWFWAGAVADDRTIFAPNMDGNIYAVDADGDLLWKFDTGSAIVSRPAVVAGGLVVAGKNGRVINLLDTKPDTSVSNRVLDTEFISDSEIRSPMFVVGNTVYVGTQGSTIIRINVGKNRAGRLDMDEIWCLDTEEDIECN